MMDKDLDIILTNLGRDADSERVRDQALRERRAGADFPADGGDFFGTVAGLRVTAGILGFRGGIAAALGNHVEFCKSFRMTSIEKEGEGGLDDIIRQYKYTFIRSVENIEKLHEDYSVVLDTRTIEKTVKKEYDLHFEGFEEKNKVNFLALVETYIELREFNSLVKKEWRELAKSIGVINLTSSGKPLYQALNSVLEAALKFCDETDEFLAYIGRILGIPADHFDLLKSEVQRHTAYHGEFSYDYNDLFDLSRYGTDHSKDRGEVPVDSAPATGDGSSLGKGGPGDGTTVPEEGESFPGHAGGAMRSEPYSSSFTVKGTRPWNTREPYIIRLNEEKLGRDGEDLLRSFYFLQEGLEEKILEGELKRSMLRFMRDSALNIRESYGEYVLKAVFTRIQGIVDFFGAADMLSLFVYHLGPYPVYMAVLEGFTAEGTGYCFKYGTGNRVVRFMPQEFIKQKVLEWFENNVNVFDLPYDSIQEYENIRKMVSKKYYAEVDENTRKLDGIIESKNLRAEKGFDRAEYFRAQWKEWFGAANIIVYNRFIEKTIFK